MCRNRYFVVLMAMVAHPCWLSSALSEDERWVRVAPQESHAILANPGMGWETFHRTADDDRNRPAWIPSTVHYARWGWNTLEPEKSKIDYGFLDGVLEETRKAGQKLAFRAMCCSTSPRQPYHPKWLSDIGGKVVVTRYDDGPELEVPVLDDPRVLTAHRDFIRRVVSVE